MSTLLWGHLASGEVPADEATVRATATPVEVDKPAAEAQGAPDWNEREVDQDPHLGMATRQVASDWHEHGQYPAWWAEDEDITESTAQINRQVASSGTAAAREAAGQQGHGQISYAIGIEPTIRDGAAFGNDYFAADRPDGVNPNADPNVGVQPTIVSRDEISALAGYGMSQTRDAAAAGSYTAWFAAMGN